MSTSQVDGPVGVAVEGEEKAVLVRDGQVVEPEEDTSVMSGSATQHTSATASETGSGLDSNPKLVDRSSIGWRVVQLLLIAFMTVGNQVSYDSVGAGEPFLKKSLKFSAEDIGGLYSAYHLPNMFVVALGGRVVDSWGSRRASLLFIATSVVGTILVALGAESSSLFLMNAARVVTGLGGESLCVAQLALLNQTFSYNPLHMFPTLAVSYALSLIVQRLGSLAAFVLLPGVFDAHGRLAFWVVALVALTVLALFVLYLFLVPEPPQPPTPDPSSPCGYSKVPTSDEAPDVEAPSTNNSNNDDGGDDGSDGTNPTSSSSSSSSQSPVARTTATLRKRCCNSPYNPFRSMQTVWQSPVLLLACVLLTMWSGTLIPFVDFATDFFNERFHYSSARASRTTSIVTVMSILLTTPFGLLVDYTMRYGALLVGGTAVALPAFYFFAAIPDIPPEFACVLLGIGSAIVSATLWPAVTTWIEMDAEAKGVVSEPGSVIGLFLALQNWVLTLSPFLVGLIRDKTGGYSTVVIVFFIQNIACIALSTALAHRTASHPFPPKKEPKKLS